MRTIHQWLDAYGASHRHPFNKRMHWLCVPAIFFVVYGLVRCLPQPEAFGHFSWAALLLVMAVGYYFVLSKTLAVGFVLWAVLVYVGNECLLAWLGWGGLFWFSVSVFVLAWIGQFIGHHIEGKKPSFLQDVQFLLIGPAWLMAFVYRKLGIPI